MFNPPSPPPKYFPEPEQKSVDRFVIKKKKSDDPQSSLYTKLKPLRQVVLDQLLPWPEQLGWTALRGDQQTSLYPP